MKKKKEKTWLPVFPGFAYSIFEPESMLERDIECDEDLSEHYDYLGVCYEWLAENHYMYTNHQAMNEAAAEYIAYSIMEIDTTGIILDVNYEKLVSPKYYNFSSDSINCEIEVNLDLLVKYINDNLEAFKADREARYTSRDGFSSHYSSDLEYWLDTENWDGHGLGSVLDFVLNNEIKDAQLELYYASNISEAVCNSEWLDETALKEAYAEHLETKSA